MKRALSVIAPLILTLAFGMIWSSPARADAPVTREARSVPAFQAIDIAGTLVVAVSIGSPARVEISGEADLVGKVTTTVKDGVLVIDTPKQMHRHNHLRATVTVPDLEAVTISGTADMTVAGIANERLALSVLGTGQLKVDGTTSALRVSVEGTGEIEAGKLAAKDARIEIAGTGQATLRASQSVEVKVSGTGSVEVLGKPARVKKSVTGTGAVHVR